MLALGLVVGWMLAGTGDESATWGAGAQLADRVDHYGYMQFAQAGPTIVIETRTGDEAVGVELADGDYYLDHYVIVEEGDQLRVASHDVIFGLNERRLPFAVIPYERPQ